MLHHVVRVKYLVDQHQISDEVPDGRPMRRIRDPRVFHACSVKTEKVVVLRDDDTTLPSCAFEVFFVRRAQKARIRHGPHVGTTLSLTPHDGPGDVFIGVVAWCLRPFRALCSWRLASPGVETPG